ncbi:MAG TPA: T9SS type A sorting domain-containing protein [Chitinophagales bacterium]|nr:T9SS type A sorting domain-containing protein [Chitinophagales bacterium]
MKSILTLLALACAIGATAQNYTFIQSTDAYTEITGTQLTGTTPWDDEIYTVPLGFTFEYRGHPFTAVDLDSYGYLNFADDTLIFVGILADFMDRNLDVGTTSISPLSYETSGTPGNLITKFQFKNVGFYDGDPADYMNFQIWLYEADNALEVRMGPTSVMDPFAAYFAPGPSTGVGDVSSDFLPVYTLFLSGSPAAAVPVPWDGASDLPTLNGTPAEGTVYRFAPETGQCGWLPAVTPNAAYLCPGQTGTLTATPTGASYQWYSNGVALAGQTGASLSIDSTDMGSQVTVEITLAGCTDTSFAVTVSPAPLQPIDVWQSENGVVDSSGAVHICEGDMLTLAVLPPYEENIQWFHDGAAITGANDFLLSVVTSGTYAVAASTTQCPANPQTSTAINVVVDVPTTPMIVQSNDTLYATMVSGAVQWYFNGDSIAGAVNEWLVADTSGIYTVSTTGPCAVSSSPHVISAIANTPTRDLSVFPNPASNVLYVSSLGTGTAYCVYDAKGQLVKCGSVNGSITVGELAPGLYMLVIQTDETVSRHAFVKQ